MSDHTLPPDISRWPNDPHQLLGVGRGVSSRDLRRAYLHLIRTYKPEHFPEQFRRIREAYETLLAFADSFPGWPTIAETDDGLSPPSAIEPIERSRQDEAVSRDPWDRAIGGEIAEAYRILSDRLESSRPHEEPYLQLYWLLVTQPGLDLGREPSDVLVRGLRACGASANRLRELLAREADADPEMAIGDHFQPLLSPDVSLEALPEILGIRWRAVQRLGRWGVMGDDLDTLRPRVSVVAEDVWARLLIAAASNLVWAESKAERTRLKAITRELESFGRNSLDLDEPLFRLDYAHEIVAELRRLGRFRGFLPRSRMFSRAYLHQLPHVDLGAMFRQSFSLLFSWGQHRPLIAELRLILALSWDGPDHRVDSLFRSHLARIARHPKSSLRTIGLVAGRAPAVFARLATLLDESDFADPFDPSQAFDPLVVAAVERFLANNRWWKYPRFRRRLLDFCLKEMIHPDAIVWSISGRPEYVISPPLHLADAIGADGPLLYVCRAAHAFAADRHPL